MLKLDNLMLTLCEEWLFSEYANINNMSGSGGFYLTINLASKAGIDEKNELKQAGTTIIREPSEAFWGGYSSFIVDPEGE